MSAAVVVGERLAELQAACMRRWYDAEKLADEVGPTLRPAQVVRAHAFREATSEVATAAEEVAEYLREVEASAGPASPGEAVHAVLRELLDLVAQLSDEAREGAERTAAAPRNHHWYLGRVDVLDRVRVAVETRMFEVMP